MPPHPARSRNGHHFPAVGLARGTLREHGLVVMETFGGYRLVRKLGDGARADVMLAHPLSETIEGAGSDLGSGSVAVKVYRSEVSVASIIREVEALDRALGPHVLSLTDVATGPAGLPCLILTRISGPSVARLLAGRAALAAGEAVTILAPLAVAIHRMHVAGVAHGDLRSEAVLFDRSGSPTLVGFGKAELIEPSMPPARADVEPAIVCDLDAFARLAGLVLSRVGEPAAAQLTQSMFAGDRSPAWLRSYVDRLFELAPALPVDLSTSNSSHRYDEADRHASGWPFAAGPEMALESPRPHRPSTGDRSLQALAEVSVARVGAVGSEVLRQVSLARSQARSLLAPVRARVWIAAGSVAAALVLAVVLVPQNGSAGGAIPSGATGIAASRSTAAPPLRDDSPSPSSVPLDPLTSDDPAAALVVLAEARDRCLRDLSILCLDDVDQEGSSALAADVARISGSRAVDAGGDDPWSPFVADPARVAVTERLGGSAIVDAGPSAAGMPRSVLLVLGDKGWRIRAYINSDAAGR